MRGPIRLVVLLALVPVGPLEAQATYDADLLQAARNAARMIPGEHPTALAFGSVARISAPRSYLLGVESSARMPAVHGAFQIRYVDQSIIVDAAGPKSIIGGGDNFREPAFDSLVAAMTEASLIVATHEHHDHIGSLVVGDQVADVRPHTLLNRDQLQTLVTSPNIEAVRLSAEEVDRYLAFSYDRVYPLAPGVSLVRMPGHTPGSQGVFVSLSSGAEYLLAGDVAWVLEGIIAGIQKPESESENLGEDRSELGRQLGWLRWVWEQGVTVIPSHDLGMIDELVAAEALEAGFRIQG